MCGEIHVYIGCMYSGKTSFIIAEYHKYNIKGKTCLCLNHSIDPTSSTNVLRSHDGKEIPILSVVNLDNITDKQIENADIILINEAQFFTGLRDFVIKCAEKFNKVVIVSGLDGDYKREPFGEILSIIPLADAEHVKKLPALCEICKDCVNASFSARVTSEKEQTSVNSKYIPLCRKHYLEINKNSL